MENANPPKKYSILQNKLFLVTITTIFLFMCSMSVFAITNIGNCTDLQDMNLNLSDDYQLTDDINCSDTISWNTGAGFIPVGNSSGGFTGTFDGNGYVISDLYINRNLTDNVGLFGLINGATVENVCLVDVEIYGKGNVGAIAGKSDVVGTDYINNTCSTGIVSSPFPFNNVGGLVGTLEGGSTLEYSWSNASVSGDINIGGIAGFIYQSTIQKSEYRGGNLNGTQRGGIVGFSNTGNVYNTLSNAHIYSNINPGGIVGSAENTVIEKSVALGNTTGNTCIGGILGYHNVGTLGVSNNFWNYETSDAIAGKACGAASPAAPTNTSMSPKTTLELQNQSTYTSFDFSNIWIMDSTGFPTIRGLFNLSEPGAAPTFTTNITNCQQLQDMGTNLTTKGYDYTLANDIDCSSHGFFTPVGNISQNFYGSFDGKGYTISNLEINCTANPDNGYCGLFGNVYGAGKTIKDFTMDNVTIYGTGEIYIGAVSGYHAFMNAENIKVKNVWIDGNWNVGGAFGYVDGAPGYPILFDNVTVENVELIVGSASGYGGIAGQMTDYITINNSWVDGFSITRCPGCQTTSNAGGLFGFAQSIDVYNSYVKNGEIVGNTSYSNTIGGFSGGIYGNYQPTPTVENCFVENVTIYGNNYVGGFMGDYDGYYSSPTFENATIKNVYVKDVLIDTNGYQVGGFIGTANRVWSENINLTNVGVAGEHEIGGAFGWLSQKPSLVKNFRVTDSLVLVNNAGSGHIGHNSLLIGQAYNTGNIEDTYIQGEIRALDVNTIGGVCGWCFDTNVSNVTVNITAHTDASAVGGLAGQYFSGNISNFHSFGILNSSNAGSTSLGGIAAQTGFAPTIEKSSAIIDTYVNEVTANTVGGLVAFVGDNLTVTDSYHQGRLDDFSTTTGGGLFGFKYYSDPNEFIDIQRTYSVAYFTDGTGKGGILGVSGGAGIQSGWRNYWNNETTGGNVEYGNVASSPATNSEYYPRTDAQMKTQSTFDNAVWDWINVWEINSSLNNGYPYLKTNTLLLSSEDPRPSTCGDGTIDAGESCDDGNLINDGSNQFCQIMPGYNCTGEPSVCTEPVVLGPDDDNDFICNIPLGGFGAGNSALTVDYDDWITAANATWNGTDIENLDALTFFHPNACGGSPCFLNVSDLIGFPGIPFTSPVSYLELYSFLSSPGVGVECIEMISDITSYPLGELLPYSANVTSNIYLDNNITWYNPDQLTTNNETPAVCGNGIVEGAETCDDNNTISGDGCSDVCQTETPTTTPTQSQETIDETNENLLKAIPFIIVLLIVALASVVMAGFRGAIDMEVVPQILLAIVGATVILVIGVVIMSQMSGI